MSDDEIRTLLAGLPTAPFIWCADGRVVIMEEHVVEAGGDPDLVGSWVEAHGGDLDRTLPVVATRRGVTAIPKPKGKRYYVVPESALERRPPIPGPGSAVSSLRGRDAAPPGATGRSSSSSSSDAADEVGT